MRISTKNQPKVDYGLLVNEPEPEPLKLTHLCSDSDEDTYSIQSASYELIITSEPFNFRLYDKQGNCIVQSSTDGHFTRRNRVPPLAKVDSGWILSFNLQSSESIYGLGEKWSGLNKRGQILHSYNCDALGVNAEISYKNVPFCWSPKGWGCFFHGTAAVTHAVGFAPWSQRSYCALVEHETLDCFLLTVNNTQEQQAVGASILKKYTDLTGRAPMPPEWSLGVILSKAYYKNANEILEVAAEVRRRNLPCDTITFDGRAWQDTATRFSFEWDQSRYPNPESVIKQLKLLNFKICIWEYPLISIDSPLFKEFDENGWLLKDSRTAKTYQYDWDQQAFGNVLTPLPVSGIVDFTHPDAYRFWRDAHRQLFSIGVDMIKADFGEQLDSEYMLSHSGDNGLELHNVYSHLYNRCVFESAERYCPSGAFLFSRASWTGCQRYNSQWGGDPQADWEGMMGNFRGGLSWGLSGAPFYATDVGGFYRDTRDERLFIRWAQAAIFSAHYRFHGIGPREPWSYSESANQIVSKAVHLRYQLHHYLYKTMEIASLTGLPVQRAMVLAFPQQPETWAFENQFMYGEDLLVAPCFSPADNVEVYLPNGEWVMFNPNSDSQASKKQYSGGQIHRLTLALDEIAVFALKGTQIPLSKPQQFIEPDSLATIASVWIA